MGGITNSSTKYVLLYGDKGSGKSFFLYTLQSSMKIDPEKIQSTFGLNYEELSIDNVNLGIFDLSGDMKQYGTVDIVTKSVEISGILFMVALDQLDELDKSKELLDLIIGNNFLKDKISLFVLYNKRKVKDRLDWMETSLLDNRLGLPKLKKKYKFLKISASRIVEISDLQDESKKSELYEGLSSFIEQMNEK